MKFLLMIVFFVGGSVQGHVIRSAESVNECEENLFNAIKSGDVNLVNSLIENGTNVNCIDEHTDLTPLHYAALYDNTEIIKMLLQHGADVSAQSNENCKRTALHVTAVNGTKQTASLLLEHGAKVDTKNCRDATPLLVSAQNGNTELVTFLIENGADVNSVDIDKNSPLLMAVVNDHLEICKILIAHKANVNANTYIMKDKNPDERTLLQAAIYLGSNETVDKTIEYLIENGANVAAVASDNTNALYMAASIGNLNMCKYLIAHGANVNNQAIDKSGPLHVATIFGTKELVKYLIEHGANLEANNSNKRTPLHLAYLFGNEEVKKVLIDGGANLNAKDKNGKTPSEMDSDEGKKRKAWIVARKTEFEEYVKQTQNV